MRFYGGRFSLLPIKQNLFYSIGHEKKFSIILELLSKRVEYKVRKDIRIIIEPILDENGVLLGGKIGRESNKKLPLKKELAKVTTKMYPYVLFLVNQREQVFLFERNSQVFSDERAVFKYLLKYLNRELFAKGIEVDIKPLTSKGMFWELIQEMDKVYSVHFLLKAPNFLGQSYEDIKEILDEEKSDSNANQIEYIISNESGELEIPKKQKYKTAIEWIEDGAGEWRVKAKLGGKGQRKKTFKNYEELTYFEVDVNNNEANLDTKKIISELRKKLDIGLHKIKGDKKE